MTFICGVGYSGRGRHGAKSKECGREFASFDELVTHLQALHYRNAPKKIAFLERFAWALI